MTTTTLSLFNKLRPVTVGFDSVFDHFESMFSDVPSLSTNYPPYNIVKTSENDYLIEVALAGFSKDDIAVVVENGMLTVEAVLVDEQSDSNGAEVLHKGISKRYFKRSFSISDDVEVREAELKDGLLRISMEKIIPEGKKRKEITIQ
ncbi:MAG: Hsp20 family protein [Acidimicrobiales bacterium]|jgi:molecular chaperone IbpA|nr:Hsp20 family protein [Acidimicrobiales bacterium]MDP6298440.1 Hsp20 family protein [Acidimicrobiales bacterium]HJM27565.1 Hsp20 family protein [Acidimicrobiales bacterium]HJM96939.1 Hsp20 family protein [Acidimicrobiales bacterium]